MEVNQMTLPKQKLKQPHNCEEHILHNNKTCTRCEHIMQPSCFCGKYIDDEYDYDDEREWD